MRELVKSSWFARLDLALVMAGGAVWLFLPDYAAWAPLVPLALLWAFKRVAGSGFLHWTHSDSLLLAFLVTAWVGYWVSYNPLDALGKACLVTVSFFLCHALSTQPEEHRPAIAMGLFVIGVGVACYFFLTHDFAQMPRKVEIVNRAGMYWSSIRPKTSWTPIHPNYASGVAAMTGIFGFYPLQRSSQHRLVRAGILAGFFVILLALILATSRGAWMAMGSALAIWLGWKLVPFSGSRFRLGRNTLFPILVILILAAVAIFLYVGPAHSPSSIAGSPDYGSGSRAELFLRSLYFVGDYPFTGAGLATFPGLYSEYMLGIPYFYVANSHNLFLDVFIEQGVPGGAAFLLLYLICVWQVANAAGQDASPDRALFCRLALSALAIAIVHGLVDDYLYNANGSVLSLLLVGVSRFSVGPNPVRHFAAGAGTRRWYTAVLCLALLLVATNFNRVRAMWYANRGAVELARIQLAGFPETGWLGTSVVPHLTEAESSLQTALEFDPLNRTANHRLGLISFLRRDFPSAVQYLDAAHQQAPHHRGIIKSLGFGYAWLGDMDNAVSFLKKIPETEKELDAYYSWWKEQGRDDLSASAFELYRLLESMKVQP